MNLAIFDIDGKHPTESVAIDEVCFVQAFRDVRGIEQINTNLLACAFQTDSGRSGSFAVSSTGIFSDALVISFRVRRADRT
jgi:hypothetical protein